MRAPGAPTDDTAAPLPAIEVVASPLSTPLVVVTDPKTPRQPLPASDGADYLKTIPGFTSIRSGGTNGDLVLRGMFGSRLNILANGMSTLGACPGRMDAPTSYIAPESYDKVTVVKGPQTVLYGPGASAGTVMFERVTPRFDKPGMRFEGSLVGGSFGRNDQNIDVTAGTPDIYGRVTANHAHSQDYKDGNGNTVPSQWDKWNADAALGWTPDDHTRVELTAGTGDGYARYAGRGMDGAHFRRETFGVSFDRKHLGDVLDRIEARVYYNEADHVMDNYTLRQPDPTSSMPMRMASEVRRRTFGVRAAATFRFADDFKLVTGVDAQSNRLDSRSAMGRQNYGDKPWDAQATMWNAGVFGELTWYASDVSRVIGGARIDYASARDKRATTSGMMKSKRNPTFDDDRTRVLPSGFIRYERDLASLPVTWYAGVGHTERYPDYWELFSAKRGPAGSVNAFSAVQPEKTTQLDIGAQYKSERLDAWVSAYAGYVQDFILFNYAAGMMGPTTQATNVNAQIMGGRSGRLVETGFAAARRDVARVCVGAQRGNRRPVAADAAARGAHRARIHTRCVVGRGAVAHRCAAASLCAERGQRGRQGLRPERRIRCALAACAIQRQQDRADLGRRRQRAEQGLHRAPEPCRQRGLRLSGELAGDGAGADRMGACECEALTHRACALQHARA